MSDQQNRADTPEDGTASDYRRRHNRWMVLWTATGSLATVGAAVTGIVLGTRGDGGDPPLVVAPSATGHPGPSGSSSAPASQAGAPLTDAQRILHKRVKAHTVGCTGVEGDSEVQFADATLACTVQDQRPASPITVASFTAADGFHAFMSSREEQEQKAEDDGDTFAENTDWVTRDNNGNQVRIGEYISYHAHGKAWVVWSFENDSFKSTYSKDFVVLASGNDAKALSEWWNTVPI